MTELIQGRNNLVTVVPLSTVEPETIQSYHYRIPKQSLPMLRSFQEKDSWVKGDMLYTAGFHRLNLIRLGKWNNKRHYYKNRLGREQMCKVYQCVLHGLNLGNLAPNLEPKVVNNEKDLII